jgi:hypothetical protein
MRQAKTSCKNIPYLLILMMYRGVEQSGRLSFASIAHNYSYDGTFKARS